MMQSLQQFARYEAYQDSGVEWLGEIPQGWQIKKVTHAFDSIGSGTTPTAGVEKYYQGGTINWLQTGDLNDGTITETSKKLTPLATAHFSTLKIYPKQSIVIAMYGATIGKLGLLDIETATNQACCVVGGSKHLFPKYVFYSFFTAKKHIIAMGYGGGQPNINQDLIRSLRLPAPPLAEQTAIANFLDQKTAEIDQAIALKTDLIERLKEYKQINIQHAVTRGLDPNAKMKTSGVEWIGDIPEGWDVLKLKYVLEERNERSLTGNEPLFMVSQIHGLVVRSEYHDKAEVAQSTIGNKIVYKDDLVFNKLKAHLGVFFRSKIEFAGIVSPDYAVYKSKGIFYDLVFLEYLFRHPAYIGQFVIRATGIVEGLIRLYTSELFQIHVPVPPLHEQAAIVAHIEAISAKIDQATDQAQQQINTLTEYKAVLINAAVTGKIKVTDDSAQGTNHAQ